MTSTGQWAWRMTRSTVLPRRMCRRAECPWDPMMIKSHFLSAATSVISKYGRPIWTSVDALARDPICSFTRDSSIFSALILRSFSTCTISSVANSEPTKLNSTTLRSRREEPKCWAKETACSTASFELGEKSTGTRICLKFIDSLSNCSVEV